MKFAIILLSAFVVSCASKPLSEKEKSVRILRKSDAPSTCKEIDHVHAPGFASISDEGRETDLKIETAKLGGDTVAITRRDENNTLFGIAYKCN
jgi:hypothetical protein